MCVSSKPFLKSDAYNALDTINMWIENCDNKASIILGSIGVFFSIILCSDFVKLIKHIVEKAFKERNLWNDIYIISFFGAVLFGLFGIWYLISCITPTIILNDFMSKKIQSNFLKKDKHKGKKNSKDNKDSIMFYGIVATMQYDEYVENVKSKCNDFDAVMEDLVFQIHSASVICKAKFEKLHKGITRFSIGFTISLVLIIVGYYFVL